MRHRLMFVLAALVVASCGDSAPTDGGGAGGEGPGTTTSGSGATTSAQSTSSSGGGGGGTIVITGTGFGARPSPGPVVFDDFEGGAVGAATENQPATVGAWQSGAGSTVPIYTDEVVRAGARSCKSAFDETHYNASLAQNLDFTVAYLDYWTYVEPLDPSPEGFSRNWKPFRLYGDSDTLQAGTTTLNGNSSAIAYFESSMGNGITEWFDGYPTAGWFHIQAWLRLNDDGQQNGAVWVRVDDTRAGTAGVALRAGSAPMNQVRVGHYWATDGVDGWPYDNPGANVYVDDVYFDTTWARVEVGDAPDYAATQHREIQIVESWTDTDVTFTLSRGTLPAGPAWAFVIGEDDTVLATQQISIP